MESKGTVLLVDNDEDMRMLMGVILKDNGFAVVEAKDGLEASRLLIGRSKEFCLVLTDYEMGSGPTGMDVLLTAKKQDPELPVVVMSGLFLEETSEQARFMADGAAATIAKPFRGDALESTVERCARR